MTDVIFHLCFFLITSPYSLSCHTGSDLPDAPQSSPILFLPIKHCHVSCAHSPIYSHTFVIPVFPHSPITSYSKVLWSQHPTSLEVMLSRSVVPITSRSLARIIRSVTSCAVGLRHRDGGSAKFSAHQTLFPTPSPQVSHTDTCSPTPRLQGYKSNISL